MRLKGHIAPISRDSRVVRVVLARLSIFIPGDQRGFARLPVVDKDVRLAVGIAAHQVVGRRLKDPIAPIGRQGHIVSAIIVLRSVRTDRDKLGLARLPVVDKQS